MQFPQLRAVNFVLTEAFTMPVLLHSPLLFSPFPTFPSHLLINSKEIQRRHNEFSSADEAKAASLGLAEFTMVWNAVLSE